MSLLTADLRALANLTTTRVGRRVTFGMGVGLLLLALMSWWLAGAVVEQSRFRALLVERSGEDPLLGLLGYALMTCPMVATWLGLALAQRQLFESSELMLWRQAPISPLRGPLQIFVRALFVSSLWCSALSAPLLVAVLRFAEAAPLAYALIPLAILVCSAPLLATLLTVQVLMVRFLSGRWLRLVLAAAAAIASVAFTIWLLLNLFTTGQDRLDDIALAVEGGPSLPLTVHAAAVALARAADGTLGLAQLTPALGWLLSAFATFGLAALLHGRAHERYLEAGRPIWRRSGRRWPSSLTGTVRKKEFAQVLQQPGVLIGFVVFAALVFVMAREHVLANRILAMPRVPRELREFGALMTWWFLAVLLVLYTHMGRLALWDGPQWPLYMASPADGRAILRGKLQAVGVFLLWPLLLVAAAGMHLLQVRDVTLLWFAGFAAAGTLAALGILAVVGTWPRLMRPDAEGQILQGGKSFVAAMIMVTAFQATMMPAMLAWQLLVREIRSEHMPVATLLEHAPIALAAAVAYGLLVAAFGTWLGGRHYRRLLAPR